MDVVRPGVIDDEASTDEIGDDPRPATAQAADAGLDLSPRAPVIHGRSRRDGGRGRRWPWIVVLVALVVGAGFVVSRGLSDATLYFYNADEAVAKQPELGTRQFRLQGTVVRGSEVATPGGVDFVVDFNGTDVKVAHKGDPPELFQGGIPVVLEGHWSSTAPGATFASDRILVKHTEEYDAKNPERVKEAQDGGSPASTITP